MLTKNLKFGKCTWKIELKLYQHNPELPTPTAVAGVGLLPPFVCLFFCTISRKPMQLGSSTVRQKCSTASHIKLFILGSIGQSSRSRVTKTFLAFVFALLWVLAS